MAYSKTTWVDRIVQFANRYTKSGETSAGVTLTADPGTVTQAGTPVNAALMNKIEQGIADALPMDGNGVMTGPLAIKANVLLASYFNHLFLNGGSGGWVVQSANAIFDGTNWNRVDIAQAATKLEFKPDGTFALSKAPAGANPITWGAASSILIADGTVPMTGDLKFPNNKGIYMKNAAGTLDTQVMLLFTDDIFYIGEQSHVTTIRGAGNLLFNAQTVWETSKLRLNAGALEYLDGGVWKGAGGVKSIQKGRTVIGASAVVNVTLSAVVTAKTTVRITSIATAGFASSVASGSVLIELTTTTNIALTNTDATHSLEVTWEVVENY